MRRARLALLVLLAAALPGVGEAQVETDGTLGPAQAFTGLDIEIPASLGQYHGFAGGGNLFHSFRVFDVPTLGSVTFTGSATDSRGFALGPIRNLVARVTGGLPSDIDGRLASLLGEQNLYLLNPAGVMFGPNATLDLPGSFHATTAESLEFPGGELFEASLGGRVPRLATVDPVAFGFLGDAAARIRVEGATLTVEDALSLRGGSVEVAAAELVGNRVTLEGSVIDQDVESTIRTVGVDSSIDVIGGDVSVRGLLSTTRYNDGSGQDAGDITIVGDRVEIDREELFDPDGEGVLTLAAGANSGGDAGDVRVSARDLRLRNVFISTRGFDSAGDSGEVTIEAGSLHMVGSTISVGSSGDGRAGTVFIDLSDVLEMTDQSGIFANNQRAPGGGIEIRAPRVVMDDVSRLQASTFETADAGSITLDVGSLVMKGGAFINASSAFLPDGGGDGGPITIRATESVEILGEGELTANLLEVLLTREGSSTGVFALTAGSGDGGSIVIGAPEIAIRDGGTVAAFGAGGIFPTGGDAGSVTLQGGRIEVTGGGLVDSGSAFKGEGGPVSIVAEESIVVSGATPSSVPSRVRSFNAGSGEGGSITLEAPLVEVSEGGAVSASTLDVGLEIDLSLIDPEATGTLPLETFGGKAGAVTIAADVLRVTSGGRIESSSFSGSEAGEIDVTASRAIEVSRGGSIAAQTSREFGDSERIYKDLVDSGFELLEPSSPGDAGSLTLRAPFITLSDGAAVTTRSDGAGEAGRIELNVRELEVSASEITASADESFGGSIAVNGDSLVRLPNGDLELRVRPDQARGERVRIEDDGLISSSVGFGSGDGGNVLVDAEVVVVDSDVTTGVPAVAASAKGGDGGNILLATDFAFANQGDVSRFLDASSESGVDGVVAVASPPTNVTAGVNPLEIRYQDPSELMASSCAVRAARGGGSFQVARREAGSGDAAGLVMAFGAGLGVGFAGDAWALPPVTASAPAAPSVPPAVGLGLTRGGGVADTALSLRGGAGPAAGPGAVDAYEQAAADAAKGGRPLQAAQALASAARLADDAERSRALLARAEGIVRGLDDAPAKIHLDVHLAKTRAGLARSPGPVQRADLLAAHASLTRAAALAASFDAPAAQSYAVGNLAELYEQEQRSDEALLLTRRALRLADDAEAPGLAYRWHWQEGRLLWEQGRAGAALRAYRRAVALLQELRPEAHGDGGATAARFRRAVAPVYLDYVDALLQGSGMVSDPDAVEALLIEARSATEALKAAELRDYFQDECVAEARSREADLDRVSRETGAAVVYPILLPDRTELLVSLPSGVERYTVEVGADRVEAVAQSLRRDLFDRVTLDFQPPAQSLHGWLVAPYESRLAQEGVTTLVFVPDGALRTIPMSVLHDGERFLAERYAVAVTPGLSLVDPRPLDPEGARLLLAGLSEPVQGFSALPGTGREVEAIHELYGGRVLLDADFQAQRFEEGVETVVPSVVHVASHAVFTGDPATSFVLTHDDRLTMNELSSLVAPTQFRQRPLELLTLSACETAAGDERAALGLAGVAIRAGARSALGSLWAVQDQATTELFVGFYEALKEPGVSKAEALQRAQLALLADPRFHHPYYWSPFLLISNWL